MLLSIHAFATKSFPHHFCLRWCFFRKLQEIHKLSSSVYIIKMERHRVHAGWVFRRSLTVPSMRKVFMCRVSLFVSVNVKYGLHLMNFARFRVVSPWKKFSITDYDGLRWILQNTLFLNKRLKFRNLGGPITRLGKVSVRLGRSATYPRSRTNFPENHDFYYFSATFPRPRFLFLPFKSIFLMWTRLLRIERWYKAEQSSSGTQFRCTEKSPNILRAGAKERFRDDWGRVISSQLLNVVISSET